MIWSDGGLQYRVTMNYNGFRLFRITVVIMVIRIVIASQVTGADTFDHGGNFTPAYQYQ